MALRADSRAMAGALRRLSQEPATVLPLLAPAACRAAIASSADLAFRGAKPVVGEGERAVHQDFVLCLSIPADHFLWRLAEAVERTVQDALAAMARPPLARFPIDDLAIQRYPSGSRGITPHRDHVRYRGLVVIIQLSGDGAFGICDDRSRRGARTLAARPGDGILMVAPGFGGRRDRPFHFLEGITAERYSFGMRSTHRFEEEA